MLEISRPSLTVAAGAGEPFPRCCRLGTIPIMNESWLPAQFPQARPSRPAVVLPGRAGERRIPMRRLWVLLLLIAGPPLASAQETATDPGTRGVRPVAVWPLGPLEVLATFDRPVDPALARWYLGRTIPYFEAPAVVPGPGQAPAAKPSGALRIVAARLV